MSQVKTRFALMAGAALLASTMLAAGQGLPDRKEGGASAQQPGASESQPKGTQPKGTQAQRPSTTGQASTPDSKVDNKAQDNKREGQNQGAREQEQKRTQGQSEQDRTRTQGQNVNPRDQQNRPQQGQNQRGQEPNRTEGRAEQGAKASGGTSAVTLSTEQRTKVRQSVIEGRGAPKVSRIDFSLSEGTIIPRSVHVVVVPEVLVEIHPEWRGYRYFVYNDEIIIVEPDTLRIVAILET